MKKHIILNLLILVLLSCDVNLDDAAQYYQFSKENYQFIPETYDDIGKIFVFKNQLNEQVMLEVVDYRVTKEQGGGIGLDAPFHYYQNLYIELRVVNNDDLEAYCDFKKINISNYSGDYLTARFSSKIGTAPCDNGSIPNQKFEFPYALSEMIIGDVNYTKVITIFKNQDAYFTPLYNFDKVYFDFEAGIIGFDDTQNNIQYRLVND